MKKETIHCNLHTDKIALHRFSDKTSIYPTILLIHGSIEDGKIFYSRSGKGFAPFLAQQGFDVFVADLRGKGESTPSVSRKSTVSQTNTILEEIPLLIEKVKELSGSDAIHLGAHSWGGVLLLSAYALFHKKWNIKSMIFLGTKRRIGIRNWEKFKTIDLGWSLIGSIMTWIYGYLPAKKLKMGSENEPSTLYFQINKWVYSKHWIDPETRFNYAEALQKIVLPPIYMYTGINDRLLGHPDDVNRLANELGYQPNLQVRVLSKKQGNLHDYNHLNILTHKDGPSDHFVEIRDLFIKHSV